MGSEKGISRRLKLLALFLILLSALIIFHERCIKSVFSIALNHVARDFCQNYKLKVQNFNVVSYNIYKFSVSGELHTHSSSEEAYPLRIKNIRLELNLAQVFYKFQLPVNVYVDGLYLDLDDNSLVGNVTLGPQLIKSLSKKTAFLIPKLAEIKSSHIKNGGILYNLHFEEKQSKQNTSYEVLLYDNIHKSNIVITKDASSQIGCFANNFPMPFIAKFINFRESTKDYAITGQLKFKLLQELQLEANLYYHRLGGKISDEQSLNVSMKRDQPGRFLIQRATLKMPNQESIAVTGYIDTLKSTFRDKYALTILLNSSQLSTDFIKFFCKMGQLTKTKEWCLRSLKAGQLIDLRGSIYIADIFSSSAAPLVEATAKFQNLDLKYSERFAQIDDLHGEITLDPKLLAFRIEGGKMIDTQLSKGSEVKIMLADDDLPILIKTNAVGPVRNFVSFIPADSQKHMQERKINLADVQGDANADVYLRILLSKEVTLANMTLNAKANFNKFQLAAFDSMKLEGDLILKIEDHFLSLAGTPLVNGEAANFKWETHLIDNQEFNNRMAIDFIADHKKTLSLKGWGVIDGSSLPTKILYVSRGFEEQVRLNSDLTNVRMELPYIALIKDKGKPATFEMVLNKQKNSWKTEKCEFYSAQEESKINLFAELSNDLSAILKLNADIKSKNNNLKVALGLAESEYKLQITGSNIVPSGAQLFQLLNPKSFSSDRKISVLIHVDKATLKNGVTLDEISGNLNCAKGKCTKEVLSMKINDQGKSSAPMKIYHKSGAFIIQSGNASALLRGLDFYNEIEGGQIVIKLYPPKKSAKTGIRGEVSMTNFKAIKTPIIARLIIMTPFSQIVEHLKGAKLISFKTFNGSFNVKDNYVKINQSIADGDLLTVTLQGHINSDQNKISLAGRLIPKCLFNRFMSAIMDKDKAKPENSALGTDYKIEGDIKHPEVFVNPISMLMSIVTKPLSII